MAVRRIVIPEGEKLSPELKEQLLRDLETNPIRKLTSEERDIYSKAIVSAVAKIPAFRDVLALLRPYMDASAPTAYTDRFARVGFGYWFFYLLDERQQSSIILHECMHVLNNHFQRSEEIGTFKNNPEHFNIAGDFEINSVLSRVRFIDLTDGLFPDAPPYNFPPTKSMEQYAELLAEDQKKREDNCEACQEEKGDDQKQEDKNDSGDSDSGDSEQSDGDASSAGNSDSASESSNSDGKSDSGEDSGNGDAGAKSEHTCGKSEGDGEGDGQGESGSGSASGVGSSKGDSWGCGSATEATEEAADEAGVQRASDVEQTITKQNTAARIVDAKNQRGRGDGHMDHFWDSILEHLSPPVVDWKKILRSVMASNVDSITKGRADYTYRRVSRRLQHDQFIFPGMVDYLPKIMLAVDTSGSMGNEDYQKVLTEVEGIVKSTSRGKGNVSIFSVDTKVGDIAPVTSTKSLRLKGGGGTRMAVAWKFVKTLGKAKTPDVMVLVTDGGIDWSDVEQEVRTSRFKSIICVTQEYGFQAAPLSLRKYTHVLNISDQKK